ncbi:hypothetical protein K450DRAFT_233630 [Umbelopsis ramanniana AG]|uniref:Chromatin modification-related protein n=1 Tax=Umbelopsis ramanniana AG TaxID=1314678 RepID=A0AAD5HGL6_UMBRA|nr:uncharacterized protein K450DRAFT_233630 [Umbelopsis ramanniana AG]KAI8581208.1 hypothetical protein K450DRAFT_233630 [Umbelopsis ramanniana AG]
MKPGLHTMKHIDSLVYLDDYIDTLEALPLELQRNFTLMRELDGYAQDLMESVASESIDFIDNVKQMTPDERVLALKKIGTLLSDSLKRGEEKVSLAKTTFDTVDRHCSRLDTDLQKFEDEQMSGLGRVAPQGISISGRGKDDLHHEKNSRKDAGRKSDKRSAHERRTGKGEGTPPPRAQTPKDGVLKAIRSDKDRAKGAFSAAGRNGSGKAKAVSSVADMPIDPNEPLYCYCQQVSYGEMVACDNDDCEIEWFHLACVNLKTVPKGKWYCDNCSAKMKGKQRK